ncbi:uncharacterized protein I303_107762 [Kwoniella dejecticola CBS 10117]|uniref:BHLH domain-containing protein n=1 Tax=Kwoniella dejecticola CBS 10117 TaxID=1296121 RepID=A0A1A5ZVN4_9TREE|nr:uncharacterized protein I303_07767 [Kwoniella dejecticola CBS 10117]OBR81857.1 hypothetical protein I303_07767 [Kwoniella dejecticola CBS 10117]
MTSPPGSTTSSSRPIHTSPPQRLGSPTSLRKNHYRSSPEERNMTASIPINIPRMPPSNPSGTPSSASSNHRESFDRPPHAHSFPPREREREGRVQSPSSGRSPTISHSYNRSHPYPRRTSSTSQPEKERERERDRERENQPRIHLPPPTSMGSFKFSESSTSHQLSPIEREFPSLSTGKSESTWRGTISDRPQVQRIPPGGSAGKSGGISLPPLHAISGSPTLPPPSLGMSGIQSHPIDASSSGPSGRGSPRVYPPNIRPGYNPYESLHSQRGSPGTGQSQLREREREREYEFEQQAAKNRQPQPPSERYHAPSREEFYDMHQRSSTVPMPNHPSAMPPIHHQQQPQNHNHHSQHPHHHAAHTYDMPSPPLRALPPSSMPPTGYGPPYGHRGGASLARSRSHSTASGFARPGGMEVDDGPGSVAPTPGQSRRLAHLMSEQKRRESINSGFQALRQALPSSLPTDSKAIILRKAVSHIAHLENIVRRSGITYSTSPPGRMVDNWSNEEGRGDLGDDDEGDPRGRVKWEEDR